MDSELETQKTTGENVCTERVSFWAVALRYVLRFGLLYVVFRITTDFDSLADLFADSDWDVYVPAINLWIVIAIALNLSKDCRLRRQNGCWVRAGRVFPKSLLWESVAYAAILLFSVLMYGRVPRETVDGVTWRYAVFDGKAAITRGRVRNPSRAAISVLKSGDVVVPSTLGGYPVAGIGGFAFHKCKRLTSVTIPDGTEGIGTAAFYGCESLTSVALPDSVKHIGYVAFSGCSNLASVTIPPNVVSIDDTAFEGTPFIDNAPDGLMVFSGIAYRWKGKCPAEVVITEDVSRVFSRAFAGCVGLEVMTIGNSVTNVGAAAFHGCSRLTSVTLGSRVASIGTDAFYACFKLSSVSIPRSLTSVGEDAFRGCPIKTVYVEKGDADRVRELLRGKGVDVDKVEFVEREAAPQAQAAPDSANGVAK